VDIGVSVAISLATTPKPESELVGLVYSLTPKDSLKHEDTGENAGWYRKPALLAGIVLVLTIGLNILF
jgi:SSS family solute:Na+ symporter